MNVQLYVTFNVHVITLNSQYGNFLWEIKEKVAPGLWNLSS